MSQPRIPSLVTRRRGSQNLPEGNLRKLMFASLVIAPRKVAAYHQNIEAFGAGFAFKDAKRVVRGDPVAPFSIEELCWVCRRLKISAWRESDNQSAIQE